MTFKNEIAHKVKQSKKLGFGGCSLCDIVLIKKYSFQYLNHKFQQVFHRARLMGWSEIKYKKTHQEKMNSYRGVFGN